MKYNSQYLKREDNSTVHSPYLKLVKWDIFPFSKAKLGDFFYCLCNLFLTRVSVTVLNQSAFSRNPFKGR